ncbi:MAG: nucleotidyltransferase family protein, partial [Elusimicrobiota bacterium]
MELLAKNLLIRKQATEAVRALESCGVDAILLKGVALMEISPEYSFEREVEDIDILIKPGYLGRAVSALESAGYVRVPSDPFAFVSPDYPVPVDISEGLWYLSNEENKKVFDNSLRAGDFRILSPADFLTHLYCHSQLHHARNEKKWLRDIEVLKTVFYSNASETFLLHLST